MFRRVDVFVIGVSRFYTLPQSPNQSQQELFIVAYTCLGVAFFSNLLSTSFFNYAAWLLAFKAIDVMELVFKASRALGMFFAQLGYDINVRLSEIIYVFKNIFL